VAITQDASANPDAISRGRAKVSMRERKKKERKKKERKREGGKKGTKERKKQRKKEPKKERDEERKSKGKKNERKKDTKKRKKPGNKGMRRFQPIPAVKWSSEDHPRTIKKNVFLRGHSPETMRHQLTKWGGHARRCCSSETE
jgi:hypothetical protein